MMKNNNLKTLVALILGIMMMACSENQAPKNDEAPKLQVQVLEKWDVNDASNVALLVTDTTNFNEATALQAVSENCGQKCNVAYFYSSKEAYDLHVVKRNSFLNPDLLYGGDYKKMIKAEEAWKKEDGHWKTVQDNLIATVSFGEFEPYPYR